MAPIREWTPQILDILKEKHAPATFFVIGSDANDSPDLIRREYDEGNEIGNHTYTHPDFETTSKAQIQLELNLTERLSRVHAGRKNAPLPPALRHRPSAGNRERNCAICRFRNPWAI